MIFRVFVYFLGTTTTTLWYPVLSKIIGSREKVGTRLPFWYPIPSRIMLCEKKVVPTRYDGAISDTSCLTRFYPKTFSAEIVSNNLPVCHSRSSLTVLIIKTDMRQTNKQVCFQYLFISEILFN